MGYIDLKYEPSKDDLICRFYLEPAYGIAFDTAAEHVAAESSIGTWTEVETLELARTGILKLSAHVFNMDPRGGIVDIAYPYNAFEPQNIPQILSSIAGNIFGMKDVSGLRLLDISIPKKMITQYKGPVFGIEGIRKMLGIKNRPLVGSIIKPKMGLSASEHAAVAYDCWVGGIDIVKDDENLSNQKFNKFKTRVIKTLTARDRAEKKTSERKIYMPNITAETEEMIRRARFVEREGGEYVMVDIVTVGWAALQTLRKHNDKLKLVLHAHRAGHAAFTRNPKHGIHMAAISKFTRLLGLDQLHIGTIVGKMAGEVDEVLKSRDVLTQQKVTNKGLLQQDWGKIKPVFPVASGGLHPGHIPKLVGYFGKNAIFQFGGGIHALGTKVGATAVRQALEATLQDIHLKEYAKTHKELAAAIEKWGSSV